ncbi:CRISPR-associated protein Cas2 [Stenotrophomonas geniculata]|uniref:CRISPR-associated protein Cas2 n=1 Tax=Stenotrophomonas geniculata TaxID=86188 RepID=UPI002949B347|nr:CRISPR-associated protein Cas2 [Stenotrophomonas geniculata]MDV6189875.1 CRISPR-associated protein Cas2 [Stenotrophomonas geniculata]
MSGFIVSYDLHKYGQNYECLKQKLEAYPKHWKMQQSVWIIESSETSVQIRDKLLACLDANDSLFVGHLSGAAWKTFGTQADGWLIAVIQ